MGPATENDQSSDSHLDGKPTAITRVQRANRLTSVDTLLDALRCLRGQCRWTFS